mgnify:CR=1 FL=1
MKHNVLKEEVDQILSQAFWNKGGVKLTESVAPEAVEAPAQVEETPAEEETVNEEAHVCPLCESHLEAPISDEQLSEHLDLMIDIIDEMSQLTEGEDADEDDGEELAEDADADDELDQVAEAKKDKKMPAFLKQMKSSDAKSSTKGPKMGK